MSYNIPIVVATGTFRKQSINQVFLDKSYIGTYTSDGFINNSIERGYFSAISQWTYTTPNLHWRSLFVNFAGPTFIGFNVVELVGLGDPTGMDMVAYPLLSIPDIGPEFPDYTVSDFTFLFSYIIRDGEREKFYIIGANGLDSNGITSILYSLWESSYDGVSAYTEFIEIPEFRIILSMEDIILPCQHNFYLEGNKLYSLITKFNTISDPNYVLDLYIYDVDTKTQGNASYGLSTYEIRALSADSTAASIVVNENNVWVFPSQSGQVNAINYGDISISPPDPIGQQFFILYSSDGGINFSEVDLPIEYSDFNVITVTGGTINNKLICEVILLGNDFTVDEVGDPVSGDFRFVIIECDNEIATTMFELSAHNFNNIIEQFNYLGSGRNVTYTLVYDHDTLPWIYLPHIWMSFRKGVMTEKITNCETMLWSSYLSSNINVNYVPVISKTSGFVFFTFFSNNGDDGPK